MGALHELPTAASAMKWDYPRDRLVYTGDLALCQVLGPAPESWATARYPSGHGEAFARKRVQPLDRFTAQQGEGHFAMVNGTMHQIRWPIQGLPSPPLQGWSFSDEEIMGDRPF